MIFSLIFVLRKQKIDYPNSQTPMDQEPILDSVAIENSTADVKFHKTKFVAIATFLGGPLAGGFAISENFKSLNKRTEANWALIIGVLVTFFVFGGVFLLPEDVIEKIPNQLIPFVYTGFTYWWVEKKFGETLKKHEDLGNAFYPVTRSILMGVISLVIIAAVAFGAIFLGDESGIYTEYDQQMDVFIANEEEALGLYDYFGTKTDYAMSQDLQEIAVPLWKENIAFFSEYAQRTDLPEDLEAHNHLLLRYSELHLELAEKYIENLQLGRPLEGPETIVLIQEIEGITNQFE
ncbi:MAG: hypothetical protein SchgKO_21420 [Schleiferiaceae bacterium]